MSDTNDTAPVKKPGLFLNLIAGPDQRPDEMAIVVLLIGFSFVLCTVALTVFEFDAVFFRAKTFEPEPFAKAAETIFGTGAKVVAYMAVGMGLKAKLGG